MGEARERWNRLKSNWALLDEDDKIDVVICWVGWLMMTAAVIVQFGWMGALFIAGAVLRQPPGR